MHTSFSLFPGWVAPNPFGPNVGFLSVGVQFILDHMTETCDSTLPGRVNDLSSPSKGIERVEVFVTIKNKKLH